MRILIEEYQYKVAAVKDILHGIDPLTNIEGKVSIHYVGYYYNSLLKDCVFILQKYCCKEAQTMRTGRNWLYVSPRKESISTMLWQK